MGDHALLSASSSHRWLHCPPSARIAATYPQTTSPYAEAGTLAHKIAELKARKYFVEPMGAKEYNAALKQLKDSPYYDKGMDAATEMYLDHLKALAMRYGDARPFVALEVRVDFSPWVPEGFGTADAIHIGGNLLCVTDYKNGAGVPVEAEGNSQMILYALGALHTYRWVYGDSIENIHLSIVQPNAGGIKEWDTTAADVLALGEHIIKPMALIALENSGVPVAGEWCKTGFCPARNQCRTRMKWLEEMGQLLTPLKGETQAAVQMSDTELGELLAKVRELPGIVKDLEGYALKTILKGGTIPGFKAVQGRSSREWSGGTDTAFPALVSRGVEESVLWTREPVTVAGLEKELGKSVFKEVAAGLTVTLPGKPTLAPASDRRKAYVSKPSADEAFRDIAAKE